MIRLKNIVIENDRAKSEILPKDSKVSGNIEINLSQNKIIKFVLPADYEWCKIHLEHAKDYLMEIYKSKGVIPKEKAIMWC